MSAALENAVEYRLSSSFDAEAASQRLARDGRVLIENALHRADADRFYAAANAWPDWNLVTLLDGRHRDMNAQGYAGLTRDQRRPIEDRLYQTARNGFQYCFENVALYEAGRTGRLEDPDLAAAFDFVRSPPFLAAMRRVTRREDIRFADCQLTRYRAGHFLTQHDDAVEGKNRVAAYVLNLTRDWRADDGGLLQFFDANGDVEHAFTPRFNALALFMVPASHAVSVVSPWVKGARYAVTGWLRSGDEPAL